MQTFKILLKIITVTFAYCYHNYFSLILLIWLFHSGLELYLATFARTTRYYFVLFSSYVLIFYFVNMLHLYEINDLFLERKWIVSIQKFNNPVIEIILM